MESDAPANTAQGTESKAQKEARLRRERRNAKLQSGAQDRLSRITHLGGRPQAAEAELSRSPSRQQVPQQNGDAQATTQPGPQASNGANASQAPTDAGNGAAQMNQEQLLRQFLQASGQPSAPENETKPAESEQDPMQQMMQQLLGAVGGEQHGQSLQSAFTNLQQGGSEQAPQPTSKPEYLWRIVHAIFFFLLGIYVTSDVTFTGSEFSRKAPVSNQLSSRLFLMFSTAELVLQGARYIVDKGELPPSSTIGKFAGFLPPPYGNYARILSRYSIIYTTVVSDALVIVFVLGCTAWWRSQASA